MGSCFNKDKIEQTNRNSKDICLNLIRHDIINRLAIDLNAFIGHLYNAHNDCLVTTTMIEIRPVSVISIKENVQPIVELGKVEDQHLMNIIGINDKELSLSIYLNLVPHIGISLLLKYPFIINQYTRYICYYLRTEQILLNDELNTIESNFQQDLISCTNATHLITGIGSGIHVIVILQLSPKYEYQLDQLLNKIENQLKMNKYEVNQYEQELLEYITKTNVFSNIPYLGKLTKFNDVYRRITEIESDVSHHRPMMYTLKPIQLFFRSYSKNIQIFHSFQQEILNRLDENLYQLLLIRKSLKVLLYNGMENILKKYFNEQYSKIQQDIIMIDELYRERMNRIRLIVRNSRSGRLKSIVSNDELNDNLITLLLEKTSEINDRLYILKEKAKLIKYLKINGISYYNIKTLVKSNDEYFEKIEEKLLKQFQCITFFCFDDKLGKDHSIEKENFYQQLIDQSQRTTQTDYAYADFTYCKCYLPQMKIIYSKQLETSINFYNVLLLGESGVGKSTFINALANYLVFDTIEQARKNQPIALMFVSFLLTIGDNFEEKLITFGDEDSNEDYHHHGQSVTQHCKSYIFTIDDHTKLRLIDTPGIGDTRGLDQDDHNMQHILSFINHFSHLNAICILLKPNESRLNIIFRSYFTRLISFLGDDVRDNILFCFTNTRSTLYAPGDTAPLLKKMLQSHSIQNIPFNKKNTFCFDSESFRYLIAGMNGIEFDDYEKIDYEHSWITSMNESHRLRRYICKELKSYERDKWQSIEHVQFQINQLIRPILETLRNFFRNLILQNQNSSQLSITLIPKQLFVSSTICFACPITIQCFSQFLIVKDDLHTFTEKCKNCDCSRIDHFDVQYELEYKNLDTKNEENTISNFEELQKIIFKLGYFLCNTIHISKNDDPIMRMLNFIIRQETQICSLNKENTYLNSQLLQKLQQFKIDYKQKQDDFNFQIDLSNVYQIIQTMNTIDSIKKHNDLNEKYRREYIQQHEKELNVNIRLTDN